MPTQNRSAHGKTVTEKPGKSKATESSQGRAQSWWRHSRACEARKVARKHEKPRVRKTTITTTNITKTSCPSKVLSLGVLLSLPRT